MIGESATSCVYCHAGAQTGASRLGDFALMAGHDLRSPLAGISAVLQAIQLRSGGRLDLEADALLSEGLAGVARMEHVLEDFVFHALAMEGCLELQLVDCGAVLEEALSGLRNALRKSDGTVQCGPLPMVYADARQLSRVFQNLIDNAIKFRGERAPEVHIAARRRDDSWEFAIRDNGIGMSADAIERVFQPSTRLHGKYRIGIGGLGLGLTICKDIVERHGGRIWVQSQLGQGATFYFTIPAEQEQDEVGPDHCLLLSGGSLGWRHPHV